MSIAIIYEEIAKKHGVTPEEVRREMQAAITMAYTAPENDNEITKAKQRQVSCKGEIPTPEEMIEYLSRKVR